MLQDDFDQRVNNTDDETNLHHFYKKACVCKNIRSNFSVMNTNKCYFPPFL